MDKGIRAQRTGWVAWLVWSVAAFFYFYEICLRMLPGIMTTHYMQHFHINATQLGVFTSIYYIAYTVMQIPSGLIVDRISIRKVLCYACLVCMIGFFLVQGTNQLGLAEVGRFLIGLGSAFAYVSCLKVASLWLPKRRFGLASCLLDSIGMMGAIFTEIVLVSLKLHFSYRITLLALFLIGILSFGFIAAFLKQAKRFVPMERRRIKRINESVLNTLKKLAKSPQLWLLGVIGCLSYLPSSVIGDVWGRPYLQAVYHYTPYQTSIIMGLFFAGWAVAGPFIGLYSDRTQSRWTPLMAAMILLSTVISIIVFYPSITHTTLPFGVTLSLFILMGVATGAHPLVFAMAKESFSNKIAGTVIASTNMLIMLGGLIFQPLIGRLLDYAHPHHLQQSIHYTAFDYNFAFAIIPVAIIMAIVMLCFVRKNPIATTCAQLKHKIKDMELTLTESAFQ